ncbi:MAG: NosD domain-containing protein [Acidobacteriaceae bacterium]
MKQLVVAMVLVCALAASCFAQGTTGAAPGETLNPTLCGTASPPAWCSGLDLGAWINAAGTSCSWACTVKVPAGVFTESTTVRIPLNTDGKFILQADGTFILFKGSGYFVDTYETGVNPSGAQVDIRGFKVTGTESSPGAVRLLPSGDAMVEDNLFTGFAKGDGVTLAGANTAAIRNNVVTYGLNGVRLYGNNCLKTAPYTCSPTLRGTVSGYAPNANTISENGFASLTGKGIVEDESLGFRTQNLNNRYLGNSLESDATGIQLVAADAATIAYNYFEGNVHNIVVGNGCCNNRGTVIRDNYFTIGGQAPNTIELVTSIGAVVVGNLEFGSGSHCFENSTTVLDDYFGPNSVSSAHAYCTDGSAGNASTDVVVDGGNPIRTGGSTVPVVSGTQRAGQLVCIKKAPTATAPAIYGSCAAVSGAMCLVCN